uniref:Uncharacterized protein n=1 Tax=Anguilla anguilla TaxID=7936 RepID=A0A0E9WLW3_ANGAN
MQGVPSPPLWHCKRDWNPGSSPVLTPSSPNSEHLRHVPHSPHFLFDSPVHSGSPLPLPGRRGGWAGGTCIYRAVTVECLGISSTGFKFY